MFYTSLQSDKFGVRLLICDPNEKILLHLFVYSVSKEFLDTQRLITHAYMCLKGGLRARHLGLHKAVCVLMGWNTVVPYDTKTWVPEVLPPAEAMSQKEDLILWPPLIVIRNISMSNNNPKEQKVIPIEQVEAFLRGECCLIHMS